MSETMPELSTQLCELMHQEQEPSEQQIRALIEQGANPNHRPAPTSEKSAMHIAAQHGYCNALRVMAEYGAEIDSVSGAWRTPLMVAARYNQAEAMQVLIELGADLLYINTYGNSVLDEAAANHAVDALRLLLSGPCKTLINKRSKPEGQTPLHQAFIHCSFTPTRIQNMLQAIDILLEAGADPMAVDCLGHTPLMDAAGHNVAQAVAKLLPISGDVNRVNNSGKSALDFAVYSNQPENVDLLLKAGADVSLCDAVGDNCINTSLKGTPHIVQQSQVDLIRLLAAAGADVNQRNKLGNSPLMESLKTYRAPSPHGLPPGALCSTLLDLGAHIPEDEVKHSLTDARIEIAQKRFDEVMQVSVPDVQHISAQDLIWFSNINRVSEVLQPALWRGHEIHLSEILTLLPPALIDEILAQQPGLVEMIAKPGKQVREWSHEPCAQAQQGRGA